MVQHDSSIANDNFAKQISCSWGGGSPDYGVNAAFKQMATQGQSYFNASGDSDAWTEYIPFLMDNTNITSWGHHADHQWQWQRRG